MNNNLERKSKIRGLESVAKLPFQRRLYIQFRSEVRLPSCRYIHSTPNLSRFSSSVDGVGKYFVFTVLPFGLSPSPFVFIKLLRPLVKYWRFHGFLIVVYIDDGISITIGLEEAKRNSKFVRYPNCSRVSP